MEVKVAKFCADDLDIARKFCLWLMEDTPHKLIVKEPEEDKFNIYWVKDYKQDPDLPDVLKRISNLNKSQLRLMGIYNYEVLDCE